MAITSNVLFAIGVSGAGAAKGKFLAVAGGAAILGQKLVALTKSSQEYSQVLGQLTTDMSEYNKRTDGLIDTTAGLTAAVKLQNAGISVSAKQMASIGVAAVKMNQSIGGGPEGATTEFNKLTKAIISGRETALLAYGIELSQTEDKALAAAEAIDKLTASVEGMSVSAQTGAEKYAQFSNSLGTFTDQLIASTIEGIGNIEMVDTLRKRLDETSNLYESTAGRVDILTQAQHNLRLVLGQIHDTIGLTTGAVKREMEQWEALIKVQSQSARLQREMAQMVPGGPMLPAALGGGQIAEGPSGTGRLKAVPDLVEGPRRRGGGGGGGPVSVSRAKDLTDLTDAEWAAIFGAPASSTAGLLGPTGQRDDLTDITGTGDFMDTSAQEAELDNIINFQERKWEAELEAKRRERELQADHNNWLLANDEEYQQAALDKRKEHQQDFVAGMGDTFGKLSSLMQTENENAFNVGKAAAISSAIINTSLAAVKSFQAMASIPYVGPALGAAAAAAAVVAGMVQVNQIRKQKFGSSGGSVSAGGGGASTGGGALAAGDVGGGQGQEQINIDVKVSGSIAEIADKIEVEKRRQEIHGQRKVA